MKLKDINSILKINKKVYSQAYLEGCNFIKPSGPFWSTFGFSSLKLMDCF